MTRVRCLLIITLLTIVACLPVPTARAELAPPGPFEQVTNTTIPAVYGELLNIYGDSLGKGSPEALKEISTKLSFYAQTISRVSGALDIGGKLYLGETQEAAISAGLLILGELAGSEAGKAYLGAMGLTTLPVTALITAYQVYQVSASELKKSTVGLKLESLYGMIEADPKLKNRNREIGVGDPIPVSSEALEYLWRKVLLEDRWRDLFKTYVVEELGRDWPEPGLWSRWSLPGNVLEESEMYARRDELESYIAGLLSYLNKAAMVREQQYVMRKYGDELKLQGGGMSSSALLNKYMGAVAMLPEVREFVKNCPARIQQGLNGDDLTPLIGVVNNSKRYAVDVLTWIPASGKLGAERKGLLDELRAYHDQAWSAREFLQERRRRDELRKAQSAPVGVWRADSYGFPLTFADLQGALDAEFEKTGGIAAVKGRIAEQAKIMEMHYSKQSQAVAVEFAQAKQLSPIPPERNEAAAVAFGEQLGAYRNIDRQLLNNLNEAVALYLDTLMARAKLEVERVHDLAAEIDRRMLSFQTGNIVAGRRVGGVGGLADTLDGYCGEFPSDGYVGLGRLDIPRFGNNTDESYAAKQSYYLSSLSQAIAEQSSYVKFCGSRISLASLVAGIDQMVAVVESFVERKADIAVLAEKIRELENLLAATPLSSNQRSLESRAKDFAERQKPFILQLQELLKKGESLTGPARSAQQRYQTDLENIEKDVTYLQQLQLILGRLRPVLQDFVAPFNKAVRHEQTMFKGSVFVLPELATEPGSATCGPLVGRRALMTAAEIRDALRKLDHELAENRLLWLDDKYQLGLRDLAALYVAERTRLTRAVTPDHYTFVDWKGECHLFTKEFFDDLKARIEGVGQEGVYFLRNLEKALGGYGVVVYRDLFAIPVRNYPVDGVYIDLDNYPDTGLDFLRGVAKNCWEDQTRASVLGVVRVFEEKLAFYRFGRDSDAYFAQMQERFSQVVGNLSSLVYDAEAAYNKDIHNPIVGELYRQAAAKESAVLGFLATVVSDPKLTPGRQAYFARLKEDYEKRFFFIRQWAKISSVPQPKPFDDQPVREFYAQFQEAYQSKNDARLMSLLSDDWEAGDGTTLFDVESYFRNMFTVFDEIRLDIRGLRAESAGGNRYRVSYDLQITGRVFADDLKHQEESSVVEEVEVFANGKVKIIRTPQGRFWYSN